MASNLSSRRGKLARLFSRAIFVLGIALLFAFLGFFGGIGYHVNQINEISFVPNPRLGYADASFAIDITYNPVTYPLYWMLGKGSISGNVSMTYLPESYERSEWGQGIYGASAKDRYGNYISYLVFWGVFENFLVLIVFGIAAEILKCRVLYVPLLIGTLGFLCAGLAGIVIGIVAGIFVALYLRKKKLGSGLTGLRGYVVKRVAYSLILVVAIITVDFVIFMRIPGNPLEMMAFASLKQISSSDRGNETLRILQETRQRWALDQPVIPQYFTYLRNLLSFNFGIVGTPQTELEREKRPAPIINKLAERLPYTIFLVGISTAISLLIGVFWGLAAAAKHGGMFDKLSSILPITVSCMPVWWIAFIFLSSFGKALGVPYGGGVPFDWTRNPPVPFRISALSSTDSITISFGLDHQEWLRMISGYLQFAFLPICTLVLSSVGQWVLLARASVLDVINEDYLLTARAKGVSGSKVLLKHALKNASLPIITNAALAFSVVVTGSILVESAFNYPGIGLWLYESIRYNDIPVLMTIFYVLALCVIVANIIADLLYGLIDPRIKTS